MVLKHIRKLLGLEEPEQEPRKEQRPRIKAKIDVSYNENTPIGTLEVEDYHVVPRQAVSLNLGLVKLVDDGTGNTLTAWEGSALRPVKATIHYAYRISCPLFSADGAGVARNAEDIITRAIIPRFTYPCYEDRGKTRIIHHYGTVNSSYLPVEVSLTIKRVDFEEKPLTLTPAAITVAEPDIALPAKISYRAVLEPSKTSVIEYVGETSKIKLDNRPPEIIVEKLLNPLYPSRGARTISNEHAAMDAWRAVKDVYGDERFRRGASAKQLSINYEKTNSMRIFIQYNAGGEWTPITYGEELDRNSITISLPDDAQHVDIQAYVYPRDVLNADGIEGIKITVDQDALIGAGYRFERRYGEYTKAGNIAGIRIYLDAGEADALPRLWSVNIKPITFKAGYNMSAVVEDNVVKASTTWSGGAVEEPAADVLLEAIHINQSGITMNRVGVITDKNGRALLDVSGFGPEKGDKLIIRNRGLYYDGRFHGPPHERDVEYLFSEGRWMRLG